MSDFNLEIHFSTFSNIFFFEEITYQELCNNIYSFSKLIQSDSVFAVQTKNPYLSFVATFAAFIENKNIVLLSHLESPHTISYLKQQIHFEKIFTDKDIQNSFLNKTQKISKENIHRDEPTLVIFSSGSTGTPKGIGLSFNNIYYSALGFIEFFKQAENEISLINLPHHHVGGLMILWRAFFSGGKVTTNIEAHCDFISLVPLQLKRMLENTKMLDLLKSKKVILIGGAQLPDELLKESKKHGLNIFETYGMTETASLVSANGIVLPYRSLKMSQDGRVMVSGKTCSSGYYRDNVFIKLEDDWITTNDIGEFDSKGIFHFKHRADLIFQSAGENINPLLIEEVTKSHQDIKEAFLVPIKDSAWGHVGVLLYETFNGKTISSDTLRAFLQDHLHPYHIPKFLFPTEFQLTGQLKVKRHSLKTLAEEKYLKEIFSYDYIDVSGAPLLVFFHGFMGNKDDLKVIGEDCLFETYSRLYIDMPGHGKTKIDNFSSQIEVFEKLTLFIKLFNSLETIFYGYSMGGRIALNLSLNFLSPSKLFLESAGLGLNSEVECKQRLESDISLFNGMTNNQILSFLEEWYKNPIFYNYNQTSEFQNDILKKSHHDFNQWHVSQKYLSSGAFPLLSFNLSKLKDLKLPLYYIYGEQDLKYKKFSTFLQDNTFEILNAGHNPHKTHAKEILKGLKFLT